MNDNILEIDDLSVAFDTEEGEVRAVNGVSLVMRRGRVLGLVGESGCGKSVTGYAIPRLIQRPGSIRSGRIRFFPAAGDPIEITALRENADALFALRGGSIGMIFQEPMTALSPVHTIGSQIIEGIRTHERVTRREARRRAVEMLAKVGIPTPDRRIEQYPFEMSGGMRQRVVIAMALACRPAILIADEPTTALDVTIQAQILALLKDLRRDLGLSILLITHDFGVVAQLADDIAVMYLGRIVERGGVRAVMKQPRHPYTSGLLRSLPSLALDKERLPSIGGSVPSPLAIPPGCPFHPRCPHAVSGRCDVGTPPPPVRIDADHEAACLRANEIGGVA